MWLHLYVYLADASAFASAATPGPELAWLILSNCLEELLLPLLSCVDVVASETSLGWGWYALVLPLRAANIEGRLSHMGP